MALHGLSLGDRQEFSLECLCLSDNKGEAEKRNREIISVAAKWGLLSENRALWQLPTVRTTEATVPGAGKMLWVPVTPSPALY